MEQKAQINECGRVKRMSNERITKQIMILRMERIGRKEDHRKWI